jgi:hypothetical protein
MDPMFDFEERIEAEPVAPELEEAFEQAERQREDEISAQIDAAYEQLEARAQELERQGRAA